ncbi:unnamed protein product [Lathyrus sativus]|nr:unnamed protein product [Lathyrus sativus]
MSRGRGKLKKQTSRPPKQSNSSGKATSVVEEELENVEALEPVATEGEKVKEKDVLGDAENPKKEDGENLNESKETLWVDVIRGNQNTMNGMDIQYVAPKIIDGQVEVEIAEEDVESEVWFYETSLIMYVIGTNLSTHAIKNYMTRTWNFATLPKMYYNDECYFILKFKSERIGIR